LEDPAAYFVAGCGGERLLAQPQGARRARQIPSHVLSALMCVYGRLGMTS